MDRGRTVGRDVVGEPARKRLRFGVREGPDPVQSDLEQRGALGPGGAQSLEISKRPQCVCPVGSDAGASSVQLVDVGDREEVEARIALEVLLRAALMPGWWKSSEPRWRRSRRVPVGQSSSTRPCSWAASSCGASVAPGGVYVQARSSQPSGGILARPSRVLPESSASVDWSALTRGVCASTRRARRAVRSTSALSLPVSFAVRNRSWKAASSTGTSRRTSAAALLGRCELLGERTEQVPDPARLAFVGPADLVVEGTCRYPRLELVEVVTRSLRD